MQGQSDRQLEQVEETPPPVAARNAIDLFAYHLEWRDRKLLPAYGELIAALHDLDADIRLVAETLLCRALVGSKGNVTRQ
jgi:hypothetical protein